MGARLRARAALAAVAILAVAGVPARSAEEGARTEAAAPAPAARPPLGARLARAFRASLTDPAAWVPAAGALVFGTTGLDADVSAWAGRETPLFGSNSGASRASDRLRFGTHLGLLATEFAFVPREGWWRAAQRMGVQHMADTVGTNLTGILKRATGRIRPDGSDDRSFPSGHATHAFSFAFLARRNLDRLDLAPAPRLAGRIGVTALAAATAWGRVEALKHHPSDVMASAALSHVITRTIDEAFLPGDRAVSVEVAAGRGAFAVTLTMRLGPGPAAPPAR